MSERKLGEQPSVEDQLLGEIFGVPPDEVLSARERTTAILEMGKVKSFLREHVDRVLGRLNGVESRIVSYRFGLETGRKLTQAQTGLQFGPPLSRWQVGRIERRALVKLRAK